MCGLAGLVTGGAAPPPARDELRRMLGAIAHRGPDGSGGVLDGPVALVHARLAVVDLEFGQQPLSNEDGSIWIAFNGEVFNHPELRARLARVGRHCRTRSDTEVIVHAYAEWGDAAWERLEGQFAIALLDRRERSVRLVRDRAGICPLFVARTADALLFASEIKAILASGRVEPRPDPAAINAVFRNWAVPGDATVFEGIGQIAPGHFARVAIDSVGRSEWRTQQLASIAARRFARLRAAPEAEPAPLGSAQRESEVAAALDDAVRLRLRADIPVGAYLSGGLDSTLLVALMARARREMHGRPPSTFSLRFEGSEDAQAFDEGSAQKVAADFLGTAHQEVVVGASALVGAVESAVWHAETPLLRAGPLPMLLLSRFVREQGFRVVLTGEGADELFGGYDLFKEARFRSFVARDPRSRLRRRLAQRLHGYLPARALAGAATHEDLRSDAWADFLSREHGLDPLFASHALRWHANAWATRFLAPEVRAALDTPALAERVAAALPRDWSSMDEVARAQELEIAAFMVPSLLSSQGDRMLLANGVEGRFPYLDGRVAEVASTLSMHERLCGLREKPLLRRIARALVPESIATRRKWPFRAPMQSAFFGSMAGELVRDCLSPCVLRANPLVDAAPAMRLAERVLATDPVAPISEREQMAAFGLVTLELWRRQFIEAQPARRSPLVAEVPFQVLQPLARRIAADMASVPRGTEELHAAIAPNRGEIASKSEQLYTEFDQSTCTHATESVR